MKTWKKAIAIGSTALVLLGGYLYGNLYAKKKQIEASQKATGLMAVVYDENTKPKKEDFIINQGNVQDFIRSGSWLYFNYHSPKEALDMLNKAQEKAQVSWNPSDKPISVIDEYKALCFNEIGMPDSASEYIQRAIKENKRIGWQEGLAENYHNLAEFYEEKKDYNHAIKYLSMSITENEKIGLNKLVVDDYYHLSDLHQAIGNIGGVKASLNRALYFEGDNPHSRLVFYKRIESVCRQFGKTEEADEWKKEYEDLDKRIKEVDAKIESKK